MGAQLPELGIPTCHQPLARVIGMRQFTQIAIVKEPQLQRAAGQQQHGPVIDAVLRGVIAAKLAH